ncbi:MAG: 3-deoxy-manno-octulosonate cytidylyltransferase [Smithella sp.]|nr:3-deoxy-manno-octulosonate cytidylyltransferase [Smithella sp.]
MRIVAVIPARYASSRFPGKLLSDICGKSVLQLVYHQVATCPGIDKVIIATDDQRIMDEVNSFGAFAVKTSSTCRSGTDRVAEAIAGIDADAIINIQGDQVVMDVSAIKVMIDALQSGCPMVTIATPVTYEDAQDSNTVKVAVNVQGNALYFSRSLIPFPRSNGHTTLFRHVGLYGFNRETLIKFTALAQTPLELTESLEQLRAVENGIPVKVVISQGKFFEINTPEDRERLMQQWQL